MWTPGERRAAWMVAALLALGTLHDLVRSARPPLPVPAGSEPARGEVGRGSAPPADGRPEPALPAAGDPLPLDLNTADAPALDALPGIGPVLAARILAERRRLGGFRSVDDLLAVPGIGPRLHGRIAPRVRVGPRR